MPKGTIRRLIITGGYGFIGIEQGEDLYFHRSQLQQVDFNSLAEGLTVEYELGQGRNGRPRAVRVRLVYPEGEERQARPRNSERRAQERI